MNKVLLLVLALLAGPAFAVVISSSATMESYGYTLIDLNPDDGVAPSLSWGATTARMGGGYDFGSSFATTGPGQGVGRVSGSFDGEYTVASIAHRPHYASFLSVTNPFTLSANTVVTFLYLFNSKQSFASGLTGEAYGDVLEPASRMQLLTSFLRPATPGPFTTGYVSHADLTRPVSATFANSGGTYTGSIGYNLFTSDVSPVWAFEKSNLDPPANYVNPIPEPSEYALMLAGLFAVSFMAKRRAALRSR